MGLADFEALSFDCYGTLIDWEAGILAILGPWARRVGFTATDETLLASFARHETGVQDEFPAEPYPEILRRVMHLVGSSLGGKVADTDAEALAVSVPDWPAFGDSSRALAELGRRYKLVILSNVDRVSFRGSNDRLGVTFDAIVTAQDVGSYKPSPANFAALLQRIGDLGVAPNKLLHVAQSLYHDHEPAKAAGLATVWIDRRAGQAGWGATPQPTGGVEPDWVFPDLASFALAAGLSGGDAPQPAGWQGHDAPGRVQ